MRFSWIAFSALLLRPHNVPTCDGFVPSASVPGSRSGRTRQTIGSNDDAVFGLLRRQSTASSSTDQESSTTTATTENEESTKSLTQRIMEKTSVAGQTGGAGGVSTWDAFLRAEENWARLRASEGFYHDPTLSTTTTTTPPAPTFVTTDGARGNPKCWDALRNVSESKELDYDVVVCGGTLGIFVGAALQLKGHRVAVVEAGPLRGREQEWNISQDELDELVELGVLTAEEVEEAVTTAFPGCRAGFKNEEAPTKGGYFENGIGYECFTPNVLNLGVSPTLLLSQASARFQSLGGVVLDKTPIRGICVSEAEGTALDLSKDDEDNIVTSRLVLDCMGNNSPITRQQRHGQQPDGICIVVGSCAGGYDAETNTIGDIIYTNTKIQDKGANGKLQYFWETFPVGIGGKHNAPDKKTDVKTTYMFSYLDADADRPPLRSFMDDYWKLLPVYQPSITNPETDLDVQRVLFAFFPTYRDSPLPPAYSRLLAVGDASGIQSPLSFGGFGALTRHLDRVSTAVSEALEADCLHKEDLAHVNAYTPNLSAAWMFQKAMSVRQGQKGVDDDFVNRLLATNFEIMNDMGKRTIMPFLQDVVRIDGLLGSLSRSFVADPTFTPKIVQHVGVGALVDWLGHVSMIATYAALHRFATPVLKTLLEKDAWPLPLLLGGVDGDDNEAKKARDVWRLKRRMESWEYGSGSDYVMKGPEWEE